MEGFTKLLSWGWDKDTKIMAKRLFTELLTYYFERNNSYNQCDHKLSTFKTN